MSLERFHHAQGNHRAGYARAIEELRAGHKYSHWIWYILPQIAGLGSTPQAIEYAIRDLDEACTYLGDPLLRLRYEETARVIAESLAHGHSIEKLMGSRVDTLKLVSSVTLFRAAARRLLPNDSTLAALAKDCDSILLEAAAQNYPLCNFSLRKIAG